MSLKSVEAVALNKLQRLTLPNSQIERCLDSQGKLILMIHAPDFPTARQIWKNRLQVESAIARLGLAQYWQVRVKDCPYTPVERILSDASVIEQLVTAIPNGTALKTALNFSKLSILRNHLTIQVEHPSVAFILLSQECICPLAESAKKLGLHKLTLLAPQTSGEWTVVQEASLQDV
jgi:hypothetical protein